MRWFLFKVTHSQLSLEEANSYKTKQNKNTKHEFKRPFIRWKQRCKPNLLQADDNKLRLPTNNKMSASFFRTAWKLDTGRRTLSITKTNPSSGLFFLFLKPADLLWHQRKGYFSGDSHCLGIWLLCGNYDCYFQSQRNGMGVGYFSGADSSRTTALDDSDGSDLRYKRSAGTRSEESILFCKKTTSSHSLQLNSFMMYSVKNHMHQEIKARVTLFLK